MNSFFYYGSSTSIPNYNCSFYTSNFKAENKHFYIGCFDIFYGGLVILLYVPSLVVFYRQSKFACFRMMLLLGIFDILTIFINSIITGFLLIKGANFCDYPDFIYIVGSIGLGSWCAACLTCLILVTNRVIDMICPLLVNIYFRGKSIWLVLSAPIFYGLFFVFFTPPVLFSAKRLTWTFDPDTQEAEDDESLFTNIPHTINNFSIVFLTTLLYMIFCFRVRKQFRRSLGLKRIKRQRKIFIQSTLLCLLHLLASILYVIMQFFAVPVWTTILAQFSWQLAQGCPIFIYLIFNHKVRSAFVNFMASSSAEKSSINQFEKSREMASLNANQPSSF